MKAMAARRRSFGVRVILPSFEIKIVTAIRTRLGGSTRSEMRILPCRVLVEQFRSEA
jgi:hypothetical protein